MTIPIFIDFEASSLSLLDSYPIEVGLCLSNGETREWLLRPHVLWSDWSGESEKVHGIQHEWLLKEGKNIADVSGELNTLLANTTVYCDALSYDSFWLHRLFKASNIKPDFELESLMAILEPNKRKCWQDTRRQIIENQQLLTHRAGNDALILHKTWNSLHA